MNHLINRNSKLFFRDKAAVFFSFLSVLITLGLYILFIGNTMQFGLDDAKATRQIGDAWIMSGIVAITGVTTTLGALGTIVSDRQSGVYKDFYCTPIGHNAVAFAYVISAIFVGLLTSLFSLLLAEVFILVNGGALLSAAALVKTLGWILLSVFSGCSMTFFIVSFFQSQSAYAAASAIVGTLIGFVAGLYFPIGLLPASVQTVVKCFPVSHAAMLLRQTFLSSLLEKHLAAAPPEALIDLQRMMGIVFYVDGKPLPLVWSVLFLIGSTALFFALTAWNLSRKKK